MGMKLRTLLYLSLLLVLSPMAYSAADFTSQQFAPGGQSDAFRTITPQSIQLVAEDTDKDKRCMMVCEEWGEDCVVNQDTGEEDCRRVCVKFGEQCF